MMKYSKIFLATVLAIGTGTILQAQQLSDGLRFSQFEYSLGTARSAAMGGAFGSLGADLSSAAINPAGIGMYQRSEFGISPSVMFGRNSSDYRNSIGGSSIYKNSSDHREKMLLNNFGMTFNNLFSAKSALTSLTFGITYNKMADFNARNQVRGESEFSLSEILAADLSGIKLGDLKGKGYSAFNSGSTRLWPAILGYQSGFVDPEGHGDADLSVDNYVSMMNPDYSTLQQLGNRTDGSIGQWDFSVGFNFMDYFYFGASIGVQELDYKNRYDYTEWNGYKTSQYPVQAMRYSELTKIDGTAYNFKVGMIFRPIDAWRIGVTYHTPTYYDINEHYQAFMRTEFGLNDYSDIDSPLVDNSYEIQTPSRLIVGSSATIAGVAILSADFERVWYNKLTMEHSDYDLRNQISDDISRVGIQPANNFRIGAEVMFMPTLFLRSGYAYYGSMFKNDSKLMRTENISFGGGYRDRNFSFDLAYVYSEKKLGTQDMYSGQSTLGSYTAKAVKNYVTLSLGVRF